MTVKETINFRYSCRNFLDEKVPEEVIRELVCSAGKAPSVNNSQPWKFLAVQDQNILRELAANVKKNIEQIKFVESEKAKQVRDQIVWFSTFFQKAPLVFFVLSHDYHAKIDDVVESENHQSINLKRNHPDIQSIGAAVQNMLLSSYDLGYASCWLSAPLVAEKEMEAILRIEKPWKITTMIAVGKPAGGKTTVEKKDVDEILEII